MLKEILEAEKKAHEEADEAEKYKSETLAAIEEEKKQILSRRMEDARKEAERLRSAHRQSVADSMRSVEHSNEEAMAKFKKTEQENFDSWVDSMVKNIIGG